MPTDAFRLARIRGIDVRIDLSWLLVLVLVTWSFWARFTLDGGHGRGTALLMAVVGALLLWASVLAHELAHAFEAQRRGVEVRAITLFVFGGATETTSDVRRPVDEFTLAAVGPLTSFVLAGVLAAVAAAWDGAADVAGTLAWLNLGLAVFNLLPGAPLDGGRILRSAVWRATGDRRRGVRAAAVAGQALGWALAGVGVYQLLAVPDGFGDGVWLVFIGWFLAKAAGLERAQGDLEARLAGVPAGRLAAAGPEPVPAGASVEDALVRWFEGREADAVTVVEDGRAVGVLGSTEVARVPAGARAATLVREAMRPLDAVPRVDADTDGTELLASLRDDVVVVTEGDRVVGVVTPARVAAELERARPADG